MKMWICRNKRNGLFLCINRTSYIKSQDVWDNNIHYLDSKLYPEVTFENSPQEVELVLKK